MSTTVRAQWHRRQGDEDDTIIVGVDGVLDLTAVTAVSAEIYYGSDPAVVLTAGVSNAATREVTVQLGGAAGWLATAKEGRWRLYLVFSFGATGPITWPDEGYGEIIISEPD